MADLGKQSDPRLDLKEEMTNYLPNSRVGNVFSASMHITCAIIGIGVLALPYAFVKAGILAVPGVALLGLWNYQTCVQLLEARAALPASASWRCKAPFPPSRTSPPPSPQR